MLSLLVQSSDSAQRTLSLLNLPHELLIEIFKAQSSFEDVSHLSQACRLLYTISHSNERAIADAINKHPLISFQEAVDLALVQLNHIDHFYINDHRLDNIRKVSSAAEAIANAISPPLLSYCYTEALCLAKAQLAFSSSNTGHCRSKPKLSIRSWFESQSSPAVIDVHVTGPFDCFALHRRVFANAQDAVRVLSMATAWYFTVTGRSNSECTVHPPDALLPHEIARLLSAWYLLKLFTLSYLTADKELKQAISEALSCLHRNQVYVCDSILGFLREIMDEEQATIFGINEGGVIESIDPRTGIKRKVVRKEWTRLQNDLRTLPLSQGYDRELVQRELTGFLDACESCYGFEENGKCEPRNAEKDIWRV